MTAEPKQTGFERIGDSVYEAEFEIVVKNAKTEPVTVEVIENFPAEWRILEESHEHRKTNAFQAEWSVPVPAEGATTLSYRVRVEY